MSTASVEMDKSIRHIPVLLNELIKYVVSDPCGAYVDCTGGGGGHTAALLEKYPEAKVIILDRDEQAVSRLKERFGADERVTVIHSNFSLIEEVLASRGLETVSGIFADFGVSSFQLAEVERGFSFRKDGPLDMRMDASAGEPVADLINNFSAESIASIIWKFGEEKFSKKIAFEIVKRRALKSFVTTCDLAEVIKNAVPKKFHKKGIHPATQSFQALRIFINGELDAIEKLTANVFRFLKHGGRFVAISFHSLEDRLVKESFVKFSRTCVCPPDLPICVCGTVPLCKILTKKPVTPGEDELKHNPLSRSAKMRAAERI